MCHADDTSIAAQVGVDFNRFLKTSPENNTSCRHVMYSVSECLLGSDIA